MRRLAVIAPVLLLLSVACQRPDVEAFRQHPRPVVVACTVSPDSATSKDFAATVEAALRVRLASRVQVVPEGVQPPPDAVRVEVELQRKGLITHSNHSVAVGVGVGTSVGVLSAVAGDRDWFFDGLFWGLFAGSNAAADEDRYAWLGYYPDDIRSTARVIQPGNPEPLAVEAIDTSDLMPALEPLRGSDGADEVRVQEAEAQAYARVLVHRLSETFQWQRGPSRYYGAPAVTPEPQAPPAEPLEQPDPPTPPPPPEEPPPSSN